MKYLKTYRLFEAEYYEDDLNVHLTGTISDIFDDLTEGSDYYVSCFTIGYKTLKEVGATHTDNDISLHIWREYYPHEIDITKEADIKTFKLDEILTYLKRSVEFMESEGRFIKEMHYQYRPTRRRVKQVNVKSLDELVSTAGDTGITSLNITFGYI